MIIFAETTSSRLVEDVTYRIYTILSAKHSQRLITHKRITAIRTVEQAAAA
ncbi:hypothetical protein RSAG8_13722, partial [Rhizoctonia solani AG-8 WAC10335]